MAHPKRRSSDEVVRPRRRPGPAGDCRRRPGDDLAKTGRIQARHQAGDNHAADRQGLHRRPARSDRHLLRRPKITESATMMLMKRRDFLKAGAAAGAMAALYGCASGGKASGHVVVVGGGYGGATVAKYLRMWSEGGVQVTLIERNPTFISCPISNLVIGGTRTMEDITVSYDGLKNHWGVRVIQDEVVAVDAAKRTVSLKAGGSLSYDRLVLSPGVDFMWDEIPGLKSAEAQSQVLHAWKAGAQTVALRKQLEG